MAANLRVCVHDLAFFKFNSPEEISGVAKGLMLCFHGEPSHQGQHKGESYTVLSETNFAQNLQKESQGFPQIYGVASRWEKFGP